MADDLQRLVYQMSSDITKLRKDTADALKVVRSNSEDIQKTYDDAGKKAFGKFGGHARQGAQDADDAIGKLNRGQLMELQHVARSAWDAMSAGASPLRVLTMEGGRAYQALSSGQGGLGGGLAALGRSFPPALAGFLALAAVLGGVIYAGMSAAKANAELSRAMIGLGAASGETIGDLNRIAYATAAAGEGSVAFAKQAEAAFLRAGVSSGSMEKAVGLVERFAAMSGEKVPEALHTLASALAEPGKGVETLGNGILNLSEEQIRHIQLLDEQGRRTEAVARFIDAIGGATDRAKPHLTELGQKFADLSGFIGGTIDKLGQFLNALVHTDSAGKLVELQAKRAQLVAESKSGDRRVTLPDGSTMDVAAPDSSATIAGIDRQIAALQKEIAGQGAYNRGQGDNRDSRIQHDLHAKLDPMADQIEDLQAAIKGRREYRDKLAPNDPERAVADLDIKKGEEHIARLQRRWDPRPKKEKAGPQDQTDTFDSQAQSKADAAEKSYAEAVRAAANAASKRAEAWTINGRQALATSNAEQEARAQSEQVAADLRSKLDAIHAEEVRVSKAKKDAASAEQLATLKAAAAKETQAAAIRQQTIDSDLAYKREKVALDAAAQRIEESLAAYDKVSEAAITHAQAESQYALTIAQQRTAALAILALQQQKAQHDLEGKYDADSAKVDLSSPDAFAQLKQLRTNYDRDTKVSQQGFDDQRKKIDYDTASPFDKWVREGQQASQQVGQSLQSAAVKGIDDFNSGIAEAIINGKSMGDVFHTIFAQMEADAIKYLAKQAELAVFGDLTGTSFLGSIFGTAPHKAGGGVSTGGPTWVGESGPEIVDLPKGAAVTPNNVIRGLAGLSAARPVAGGGDTYLHVAVNAGGAFSFDHVTHAVDQGVARAIAGSRQQVPADLTRRQRQMLP